MGMFSGCGWDRHPLVPIVVISAVLLTERELVLPVMPLFVFQYSDDPWLIAMIGSCTGIGRCLFGIPSGALVAKFGSKNVFIMSCGSEACAALMSLTTTSPYVFGLSRAISGASFSLANVARQVFVTEVLSKDSRGKANSIFAGIRRAATFVSPIAAGFMIEFVSYKYVFILQLVLCGITLLLITQISNDYEGVNRGDPDEEQLSDLEEDVTAVQKAESAFDSDDDDQRGTRAADLLQSAKRQSLCDEMRSFVETFKLHWFNLFKLSVFGFLVKTLRATRRVALPYVADFRGLTESQVGFAVGLGSGFDTLLVPVGGFLQDIHGRKLVGITSSLCYGLSFFLLMNAKDFIQMCIASSVGGIANGLTAGVLLTVATDLASTDFFRRGQIIGIFQFLSDIGSIIGPIGSTTIDATLLVTLSLFSTFWAGVIMPETKNFEDSHPKSSYATVNPQEETGKDADASGTYPSSPSGVGNVKSVVLVEPTEVNLNEESERKKKKKKEEFDSVKKQSQKTLRNLTEKSELMQNKAKNLNYASNQRI